MVQVVGHGAAASFQRTGDYRVDGGTNRGTVVHLREDPCNVAVEGCDDILRESLAFPLESIPSEGGPSLKVAVVPYSDVDGDGVEDASMDGP